MQIEKSKPKSSSSGKARCPGSMKPEVGASFASPSAAKNVKSPKDSPLRYRKKNSNGSADRSLSKSVSSRKSQTLSRFGTASSVLRGVSTKVMDHAKESTAAAPMPTRMTPIKEPKTTEGGLEQQRQHSPPMLSSPNRSAVVKSQRRHSTNGGRTRQWKQTLRPFPNTSSSPLPSSASLSVHRQRRQQLRQRQREQQQQQQQQEREREGQMTVEKMTQDAVASECSSMNSSIAQTPCSRHTTNERESVPLHRSWQNSKESETTNKEPMALFTHTDEGTYRERLSSTAVPMSTFVVASSPSSVVMPLVTTATRNKEEGNRRRLIDVPPLMERDTSTTRVPFSSPSFQRGTVDASHLDNGNACRVLEGPVKSSSSPLRQHSPFVTATLTTRAASASRRNVCSAGSRSPSPQHMGDAAHTLPDGLSEDVCRCMSIYDAFFFDRERSIWLVDDAVFARCLDYIGLMGYDSIFRRHLLCRQQQQQQQQKYDDPLVARGISALIPSPLVRSAIRVPATTILPHTVEVNNGLLYRWSLASKPTCAAARSGLSTLLLDRREAERWLSEQEYVIGTILSCCSLAERPSHPKMNSNNNNSPVHENFDNHTDTAAPYLSSLWHPILQTAMYVIDRFPHWGSAANFMEAWEKQVVLVLGTAAPSHQRIFQFPVDGIVFSSEIEGGNLARAERAGDIGGQPAFDLWMEPDMQCEQRLWFRFSVAGARPGCTLYMRINNIQPNTKLYLRNGMRPVWRSGEAPRWWTPVSQCGYRVVNNEADGELTFVIIPRTTDVVHVAFCVPYTYADLLCHISHWHYLVKQSAYGIRFEERVLCYTQDGRKLHLLVITSVNSKSASSRSKRQGGMDSFTNNHSVVSPYVQFDGGKKVVLLSGRVHPGEVTASHGIHGAISFLLSRDPNASLLRDHFVFYIVPMLNPDGVSRGHSRLDQNGFNLNRCYNNPNPMIQPTVHALRKVFEHLQRTFRERFFMYIDFHSHASQSSGFMFGNFLPVTVHHWNVAFPKIVSLHARDVFSFQLCRFGRGHMTSKEGSSRVLFGGSLVHSYTVELTHFTNNRMYVDGRISTARHGTHEDGGVRSSLAEDSLCAAADEGDTRWEARYANTHGTCPRLTTAPRALPISPGRHRSSRPRGKSFVSIPPRRGHTPQPRPETNPSMEREALRTIDAPCVLSQSAEVGRACLTALMDYCAVANRTSAPLAAYGGLERVLREAKRQIHTQASTRPESYGLQLIFKQY